MNHRPDRTISIASFTASLLIFWTSSAHPQSEDHRPTHGLKTARASAIEEPILVDGSLDEEVWRTAPSYAGFVQQDPQEGEPATEQTEFRIVYTPSMLYIGVIAYDSDPQSIMASERRRDADLTVDDTITVVIDTFHDHRNGYRFRTNPLGTQQDALITDEGRDLNEEWDEQWEAVSRVTDAGWTTEFAIPFKSLRVPIEEDGAWGIDIQRSIRRKNEDTFWTSYRRGFTIEQLSQVGHLAGITEIETGLKLRVKPYLLGGFSHTNDRTDGSTCRESDGPLGTGSWTCNASDAGIEVIKYRITPSLTADFTYRTDFAQTEVDDQAINLDRFPLFFPEKREFFLEGAGVFEFGVAPSEGGRSLSKLFHSRQIGLSPRRQPIPIVAGGRITGRAAGMTLGMLNIQTERHSLEDIAASNYSVFVAKKDILERSTIGAFFLNREMGGNCDYNRVGGMEANFVFYQYFSVGAFAAKSTESGSADCPDSTRAAEEGSDWLTAGHIRWDSDFFNLETSWLTVDDNFRDDLGFVPRKGRRDIMPQIGFRPRPRNNKYIRQFIIRWRNDYTMNQQNQLESRVGHAALEILLQNGDVFGWVPHTRFDTFTEPFTNRSGVWLIPPGSYSWWNNALRYNLNPGRVISGQIINWAYHVGYFGGGTFNNINMRPRLRLTDQMTAQIRYGLNKATFPTRMCVDKTVETCGFTDHLVNARLEYNFNNQWLTSTTLQYNSADNFWGVNVRLNYIFRPGDDFFLIYNEGRRFVDSVGVPYGPNERTLQAKLTYSFDY